MTFALHPNGEYKVISYHIRLANFRAPVQTSATTPPSGGSRGAEAQTETSESRSRFSRKAVSSAAGIVFVAGSILDAVSRGKAPSLILIALNVVIAAVSTAGGWTAISQIRRSAGKLRGLGLALFDGLLFPLLALDGLIFGLTFLGAENMAPWYFHWERGKLVDLSILDDPMYLFGLLFLLLVTMALNLLIVRREWLAVNKTPSENGETKRAPSLEVAGAMQAQRELELAGRSVMWLGVLGLVLMLLLPINGWSADSVMFGCLLSPSSHWRLPLLPKLYSVFTLLHSLSPAGYVVMCVGGYRMRRCQNYRLAQVSAMMAIVTPPLFPLLFPVALPIGLWALLLLARKEVRQEFDRSALTRDESRQPSKLRFSRIAVVGAVAALFPILGFAASVLIAKGDYAGLQSVSNLQKGALMSLGFLGQAFTPLTTVLLSWIAWEDIRRRKYQLRGVALTIFACIFPFSLRLLSSLQDDWPDVSKVNVRVSAILALELVVFVLCAAIALWVQFQESERVRSDRTASPWWLHSPAIRWVIVGIAVFSVWGIPLRTVRTVNAETAKALSSTLHHEEVTRPSFGPVIERVVHDTTTGEDCALDLDTGELLNPPPEVRRLFEATNWCNRYTHEMGDIMPMRAWARASGADLVCGAGIDGHKWGLTLLDGESMGAEDFWNMEAARVVKLLREEEALGAGSKIPSSPSLSSDVGVVGNDQIPRSCSFKTKDGSMGVYEITSFTDNPRGVKIRYKLVKSGGQEPMLHKTDAATKESAKDSTEVAMNGWHARRKRLKHTVLPGRHLSEHQVVEIATKELPQVSDLKCEFNDGVWEILEVQKDVWGVSSTTTNADGKVVITSTNATKAVLRVRDADAKVEQVAAVREDNEGLDRNTTELLKLRGEVARPSKSVFEKARAKRDSLDEFQFRWVAADDDTHSPVDVLYEVSAPNRRSEYRVLRDVVLSSLDVDSAGFTQYQSEQKELAIFLNARGGEKFAEATAKNIGRQLAVVWRGRVISAPVVRSAIPGRRVSIVGNFSDAEAQQLLDVLNHRQSVATATNGLSDTNVQPATNAPAHLARSIARANDMRQVLIAAKMFADTNRGEWPISLEDLSQRAEQSFIRNISESLEYYRPTHLVVATNGSIDAFANPVLFEKKAASGDGEWVGFADGHLVFLKGRAKLDNLRAAARGTEARRVSHQSQVQNSSVTKTNRVATLDQSTDLKARIEAAKGILDFTHRDSALAVVARDAARAGNFQIVQDALGQMTAFPMRDQAALESSRALLIAGRRAEAIQVAKNITAFPQRDAALKELAQ